MRHFFAIQFPPLIMTELTPFLPLRRSRSTDLRDANHIERILATCRTILTIGALVAGYFSPDPAHAALTHGVLIACSIYSVTILVAGQFRSLVNIRAAIHLIDLSCVALLSSTSGDRGGSF